MTTKQTIARGDFGHVTRIRLSTLPGLEKVRYEVKFRRTVGYHYLTAAPSGWGGWTLHSRSETIDVADEAAADAWVIDWARCTHEDGALYPTHDGSW